MESRLQRVISRVHDEHREWLDHREGVPIQRLRVEAGTIAICGDREGIDRRGRQAITFVRPDGRLTLLTLADEADVAAECKKYKDIPLAQKPKFNVVYRGKPREFQATTKQFLMGVCDCEGQTVLVACVDGGLLYCVTVGVGTARRWVYFQEPSWTAPFDVDLALRVAKGEVLDEPQTPPARIKARARPPQVDDRDEEVQEHYARLAEGVVVQPTNLSILKICFDQLHLKALLPNPAFAGDYQGRKYVPVVVAGLLKAIAGGCGDLGGREKDMLERLKEYGVLLPRGALSAVLRLFRLLGCPIVSLFEPMKGRTMSKLWKLEFAAALDPKHPKHLALLKSIDTPLRTTMTADTGAQDGEAQGEGSKSDPDEADSSTGPQGEPPEETRQGGPETDSGTPAGELADPMPGASEASAAVDASPWRSWLSDLSEPLRSFMGLTLTTLTLLSQEVVRLHQRLEATSRAAAESWGHNEAPVERVVNVVTTDVPCAREYDSAERVDTDLAFAGEQPDGDELPVDGSLLRTPASEAERDQVDTESLAPLSGIRHRHWHGERRRRSRRVGLTRDDSSAPSHTTTTPQEVYAAVPLAKEWKLTLDRWNFAATIFLVMFELEEPKLIRVVVIKAIDWMTEADGRVGLTCQTRWPRARNVPGVRPKFAGLACSARLNATESWVPAQVEWVDAGPRGPPLGR